MKKNVKWNMMSRILTLALLVALCIGLYFSFDEADNIKFYLVVFVMVGLIVPSLFYAPIAVSVDEDGCEVHKLIGRRKKIRYEDIASVNANATPLGAIRTCASGGFMGYWGWFSSRTLGSFFGYFGDFYDCFLVTLKSGRQYMIGCEDSKEIADFISSKLNK